MFETTFKILGYWLMVAASSFLCYLVGFPPIGLVLVSILFVIVIAETVKYWSTITEEVTLFWKNVFNK